MQRRTLISVAAAGGLGLALPALPQVLNLGDAINKAGRQRMLSQRMGKAWLALVQNVEKTSAQMVLDKSMALFDRQLQELKNYAPTAEVQATYNRLDAAWFDYKAALVGTSPLRENAAALLQLDAKVLGLANQGTQQFEAVLSKPMGKLVNMAGRQRMLTQRMAKFYLAATLPVEATMAGAEINKSRTEFTTAMAVLRTAPEATARIKEDLLMADAQWVFFDAALQQLQAGSQNAKPLANVFIASENLLTVMDRVTGQFATATT